MGQNGRVSRRSEDSHSLIHQQFALLRLVSRISCHASRYVTAPLVFVLLLSLPATAKDLPDKNNPIGLHIKQTGAFNNIYDTCVTPDAVYVENKVTACRLLSKAPDWKVYLWRDKSKQMAQTTFADWCKQKIQRYAWASELIKPIKTQSSVLNGDKHFIYTFGTTTVVEPFLRSNFGSGKGGSGKGKGAKEEENSVEMDCLDYPGSSKTGPILGALQSLPALPGIPLTVKRLRPHGLREFALSTHLLEKTPIDKSVFELPKGYKPVKFSIEFVQGEARNENIKSLFEELAE